MGRLACLVLVKADAYMARGDALQPGACSLACIEAVSTELSAIPAQHAALVYISVMPYSRLRPWRCSVTAGDCRVFTGLAIDDTVHDFLDQQGRKRWFWFLSTVPRGGQTGRSVLDRWQVSVADPR